MHTDQPPAIYDHAPAGHMDVQRMTPVDASLTCAGFLPHPPYSACAILWTGRDCTVILPHGDDTWLRHERAHCNGWKHPE